MLSASTSQEPSLAHTHNNKFQKVLNAIYRASSDSNKQGVSLCGAEAQGKFINSRTRENVYPLVLNQAPADSKSKSRPSCQKWV